MAKRAFTLIELMVTVAVLAILMGVVFRLSGTGGESWRRTKTIARLQRLENCLSGYNAAFGSYPPVKLHGTRDIYLATDARGLQTDVRNEGIWGWDADTFLRGKYQKAESDAWEQVHAACASQPVDCRFPFPESYGNLVGTVSREVKRRAESHDEQYKKYWQYQSVFKRMTSGFDGLEKNVNRLASHKSETDWRNLQLFKFGLMSFLLPRYLVMMNADESFYGSYAQWTGNNTMPSNPLTGRSYEEEYGANAWSQLRRDATSTRVTDLAKVANIPSQAVCARWMPNLANTCHTNHKFVLFGIDIKDDSEGGELSADNTGMMVYYPGSSTSGGTGFQDPYVLDGVTVRDGWGNDFYYYSPYPHQKYVLWSAGANERTFPPWVSRDSLPSRANACVAAWTADDIIHMSN